MGIGDYEKSHGYYQKVLAVDPDNISGHAGQCVLDVLLGRPEPALAQCQRAVARSSKPRDLAAAYEYLAFYYSWRGRWAKAAESAQLGLAALHQGAQPIELASSELHF